MRHICDCKLRKEKSLFQVCKEFSLLTSKFVTYVSIKKQEGVLVLKRSLRGWGSSGFFKILYLPRTSLYNLSKEPNFGQIQLAGQYL